MRRKSFQGVHTIGSDERSEDASCVCVVVVPSRIEEVGS